jgi:hypothetical protein
MTLTQKAELRIALRKVFAEAIEEVGLEAFKRTSLFGSNDPAYKNATLRKAA